MKLALTRVVLIPTIIDLVFRRGRRLYLFDLISNYSSPAFIIDCSDRENSIFPFLFSLPAGSRVIF